MIIQEMKTQKKNKKRTFENIFQKHKSFNIPNRSSAIQKSIQNAAPGETILVAGKGHEEAQIYKKQDLQYF